MDMNMLGEDVGKALDKLPPDFVKAVLGAIMMHGPQLMGAVPELIGLLKPHFAAGSLEVSTGLVSMDELAQTLLPVLQQYMVKHAATG